jgi:predicted nucleic acid-binding protein
MPAYFFDTNALCKYYQAEPGSLLLKVAPNRNLRTLDALQLAVALDLNRSVDSLVVVTSDRPLAGVAADEGLQILDPELPANTP